MHAYDAFHWELLVWNNFCSVLSLNQKTFFMKKLILAAILFSALQNASAENSIRVNSTIQNITVFRRGAEVNHTAKAAIPGVAGSEASIRPEG